MPRAGPLRPRSGAPTRYALRTGHEPQRSAAPIDRSGRQHQDQMHKAAAPTHSCSAPSTRSSIHASLTSMEIRIVRRHYPTLNNKIDQQGQQYEENPVRSRACACYKYIIGWAEAEYLDKNGSSQARFRMCRLAARFHYFDCRG